MSDKCCVHPHEAEIIKNNLPDTCQLFDLAELFKMFGDSTRISIISVLMDRTLCVGDIAAALDMGQSAISHQLRLLRQSGLVRCKRQGKTMLYTLADSHVHDIYRLGWEHINEKAGEADD